MADRARVHVLVSGIVQGVSFRHYTVVEARGLNLFGWVRNLPDGRVEALAEGERAALEKLLISCWSGPPGARVEDVQATWSAFLGDLGPFAQRR